MSNAEAEAVLDAVLKQGYELEGERGWTPDKLLQALVSLSMDVRYGRVAPIGKDSASLRRLPCSDDSALGVARHGLARHGLARHGLARHGLAMQGT